MWAVYGLGQKAVTVTRPQRREARYEADPDSQAEVQAYLVQSLGLGFPLGIDPIVDW